MFTTLLLVIVLVAIIMVLLAIQILFKKNGSFPKTHIEDNEHLKKRGITCASHDDYVCSLNNKTGSACESCSLSCPADQL